MSDFPNLNLAVRQLRAERNALKTINADVRRLPAERDAGIVADRRRGMTYQDIGDRYGITKARVALILKNAEAKGATGLVGDRYALSLRHAI